MNIIYKLSKSMSISPPRLTWHWCSSILIPFDYRKKYKDVPIATLQMLWGKLYAVWDPQLVQAALRSRVASQEPFVVEFAQKSFGLSAETFAKVTSNPDLVPAFTDAIHNSMNSRNVNEMNTHSLEYISQTLDNIKAGEDGGLEVPNLYLWVRDIITLATGRSLLGKENPFEKDSSLIECLWLVIYAVHRPLC